MSLYYYKLHAGDFDSDERVRLMTRAQKGMYVMLLNHAWRNDGLPENPEMIRKCIADDPEEWKKDWPVVEPCFPISEGGRRRNPRQERERTKARKTSQKNSISGKKGALARWRTPYESTRQTPSDLDMANAIRKSEKDEWRTGSGSISNCSVLESSSIEDQNTSTGVIETRNGFDDSWMNLLAEMEAIYKQAGVPISPQQRQLALQLLISLLEEEKTRVRERLPNFCKWALATGRWPSPAKTKSLVNVLRDGDWDVELTPRTVPVMTEETAKQRLLREQEERIMRRHNLES